MKIISLTAENVKKLTAVQIEPNGNLVQITGKNSQGKTSVLDSIWWALGGLANVQGKPIREGAKEARITLNMGEVVVTRTFKDKEGTVTSSLKVEQDGQPVIKSPQALLDGLLDALAFDPLAFSRMDSKAQFNELKKFVPGVDFEAIERENKKDYDERTILNRQAKEEKAVADSIVAGEGTPIDESALLQQMADAAKFNDDINKRSQNRKVMADKIVTQNKQLADWVQAIEDLQKKVDLYAKDTIELERKLAAAPPLAPLVDVTKLQQEIENAKKYNQSLGRAAEKRERASKAESYQKKADEITKRIDARNEAKSKAIAGASLPVQNVSFGDDSIKLNGVPFNQASDAEQLRASIAIAMASNSKLRVLRVRDGSLLDEDSLKLLAEMADKNDYQVWIERVESSGKVGFVLEDGHVKGEFMTGNAPDKPMTASDVKKRWDDDKGRKIDASEVLAPLAASTLDAMTAKAAAAAKGGFVPDPKNPFVKHAVKTPPPPPQLNDDEVI